MLIFGANGQWNCIKGFEKRETKTGELKRNTRGTRVNIQTTRARYVVLTYILTSVKLAVKETTKRGHKRNEVTKYSTTKKDMHSITSNSAWIHCGPFLSPEKFSSHTGEVHQSECTSDFEGERRCQASGYDSSQIGIQIFSPRLEKVFDRRSMVAAPYIPPLTKLSWQH